LENSEKLINFIKRELVTDPNVQIELDTPLVSSGLIDSLALVDVLGELEDVTKTRIPAGKVHAKDMDTIRLMLATAARVGRAR
jgi:acyl carrier protein